MGPPIEPNQFWLYYAGGTLLVLLLLFWRRPRRGMRLRLKGGGGGFRRSYKNFSLDGRMSPEDVLEKSGAAGASVSGERSINVVFNYNGHSWDAHEVLGVPAGCSFEAVEAAYQEGLKQNQGSSKLFIEAAYQAIRAALAKSRAG